MSNQTLETPKKPVQFRQGDIFFREDAKVSIPEGVKPQKKVAILVHSAVTGHQHRVTGPKVAYYEFKTDTNNRTRTVNERGTLVIGKGGAKVTHNEHGPINLPAGKYIVRGMMEWRGVPSLVVD